jgi:hypothetical protein
MKIYDKVQGRLSELQSRIDEEYPVSRPDQVNLWQGKLYYFFPAASEAKNPEIDFMVPSSGIYTLKFTLTIYPDDQLAAPGLDMFIYSVDSTSSGGRHYFPSIPYIKDGLPHTYKSTIILKNPGKRQFIKGWFVPSKCLVSDVADFISVENISLSRAPLE